MFGKIFNSHGETIDYAFHEGSQGSRDLFIIGHGVTGNKDRPFVEALALAVSREGVPALRISFTGNGDSGGRFEDCTISKEVEDLKSVLTAVESSGLSVTYAGHSMGGAVGVLAASSDTRIRHLISLAGMVNTEAFYEREFGEETPDEGCMWEDASCPLSSQYLEDMKTIGSVATQAPLIRVPWLLVHGTADDVVPIEDSREIFDLANQPKKLIEIPEADHVFSDQALVPMCEAVISWMGDTLRP
ncbi:MAG: alpha/beta hydrolase [Opitutae bacterium]|nr:alpha/beta hydrolase [Opitutae bacterium]|tara:strand:+ start:11001 stop:11735 length:735 start_codon:yes stop_codon:yes gene_type:complete